MSNVPVRGPQGCAKTLSFGGETITANKRGVFLVPAEAAEHLKRHVFVIDGEEPAETDEERQAREQAEAEEAARAAKEAEAARVAAEAAANGGKQP